MTAQLRSPGAGWKRERSWYARLLGLRYLRPSGMLCFLYFEGAITLAILLALAELVTWWAVVVLPAAIAGIVKINDVIAGYGVRAAARARSRAVIRSAVRQAAALRAAAPITQPEGSDPAGYSAGRVHPTQTGQIRNHP